MKTRLVRIRNREISYDGLMFVCPGCVAGGPEGYTGLHILPVNAEGIEIGRPWWHWDGDLEKPTLSPSVLTHGYSNCHSFLVSGIFQYLEDSTHPLSGQRVPIPDLPDWAEEM